MDVSERGYKLSFTLITECFDIVINQWKIELNLGIKLYSAERYRNVLKTLVFGDEKGNDKSKDTLQRSLHWLK